MPSRFDDAILRRQLFRPMVLTTVALLWAFSITPWVFGGDWPGWRGDGSGTSTETGLPQTWSSTENVLWRTPIPGEGFSSPIVCKDRVFLTAAVTEAEWGIGGYLLTL